MVTSDKYSNFKARCALNSTRAHLVLVPRHYLRGCLLDLCLSPVLYNMFLCVSLSYDENFLRETYRATRLPKLTRLMSTWESFYSLLSLVRYKGQLGRTIPYTVDFGFVFSCCLSLSLPNMFNQESLLHSYCVHPPISNGRLRE